MTTLGSNVHGFPTNDPITYLVKLYSHHPHATTLHWVYGSQEWTRDLYDTV